MKTSRNMKIKTYLYFGVSDTDVYKKYAYYVQIHTTQNLKFLQRTENSKSKITEVKTKTIKSINGINNGLDIAENRIRTTTKYVRRKYSEH